MIEYYKKHWLGIWLSVLIIGVIITGIILAVLIFPNYDINQKNDFPNWATLILEILVGVAIALIIFNHTKKIEVRELNDVDLTIVGTYHNLWNLHLSMKTYEKAKEVRADKILALQILQISISIHSTLSKCGQKIDSDSIETLQLHMVLIQNIIRASMDPRANIEDLWSTNKTKFLEILNDIKEISQDKFEPLISKTSRATWSD